MSVQPAVMSQSHLPVAKKRATGSEFAASVRRNDARGWDGYQIVGDVDLHDVKVSIPLSIEAARFTGNVDFTEAHFARGLDLTGCHFERKLILTQARIDGPLALDRVIIGAASPQPPPDFAKCMAIVSALKGGCERARSLAVCRDPNRRRLGEQLLLRRFFALHKWERAAKQAEPVPTEVVADLDGARVEGFFSFIGAQCMGGLSAAFVKITSDVRLDGVSIYGNVSFRHAWLGEVATDATKRLHPSTVPPNRQCRIDGELILTSADITGDVRLSGLVMGGELTLQATRVQGNVRCRREKSVRTRFYGGVWMMLICVRGAIDFSGARIDGDVEATAARIGGWCAFLGVRLAGNFHLNGARIENGAELEVSLLAEISCFKAHTSRLPCCCEPTRSGHGSGP